MRLIYGSVDSFCFVSGADISIHMNWYAIYSYLCVAWLGRFLVWNPEARVSASQVCYRQQLTLVSGRPVAIAVTRLRYVLSRLRCL